ncbi:hypothetical protein GUJ93_ZPchr0458g22579 [Zizania palustris]|uniref:Uncharacterized protein n=1 Tax=Zizania palustris TaxID=103762 RepID=A0A8J5RBQ8_ZIZPA|nr:hypothetical protein GUJ93_ZPchr0458g22579 [Zizania palustris]
MRSGRRRRRERGCGGETREEAEGEGRGLDRETRREMERESDFGENNLIIYCFVSMRHGELDCGGVRPGAGIYGRLTALRGHAMWVPSASEML